jgi:hypothetical protein
MRGRGNWKRQMTTPRPWPNNARFARDRAAEEVAALLHEAGKLQERVSRGEFTRAGLEVSILQIQKRALVAIRHLEAVGAATVPD